MAANPSGSKLASVLPNAFTKDMDAEMEKWFVKTSKGLIGDLTSPLVAQMGLNEVVTEPIQFFDNACGAGVLTQEVHRALKPEVLSKSTFTCADFSDKMVATTLRRAANEGWGHMEGKVVDGANTGFPDASFSHIGISLGLHIIPDPDRAVKDALRMLKPGGVFGATTFTKRNGEVWFVPDVKSAFKALPFDAPIPDLFPMQIHSSGTWTDAAWVEAHLKELGVQDVQVHVKTQKHKIESAEDYVNVFKMMFPMTMKAYWPDETLAAHPPAEVVPLVQKHLEELHGGQGWEIESEVIYMTGKGPQ